MRRAAVARSSTSRWTGSSRSAVRAMSRCCVSWRARRPSCSMGARPVLESAVPKLENQIVTGGHPRSSSIYGDDYLDELRRVLMQHVKPVTRAYLEWGAGNTTLAILQMRETLPLDDFFSIEDNQ